MTPFQAEFEEIRVAKMPGGKQLETRRAGAIYRDSAGRLRQEMTVGLDTGGSTRLAIIVDPSTHDIIAVDAVSGRLLDTLPGEAIRDGLEALASQGRSERLAGVETSGDFPGQACQGDFAQRPEVEALGTKDIEGLVCQGRRLRYEGCTVEIWSSPVIADPPVLHTSVSAVATRTFRLLSIRLGEPPATLFVPLRR